MEKGKRMRKTPGNFIYICSCVFFSPQIIFTVPIYAGYHYISVFNIMSLSYYRKTNLNLNSKLWQVHLMNLELHASYFVKDLGEFIALFIQLFI